MDFLADNFYLEGSNKIDLLKDIDVFSENTFVKPIDPYDLTICSVLKVKRDGIEVLEISPENADISNIINYSQEMTHFIPNKFLLSIMSEDILWDVTEMGFFFKYEGNFVIPCKGMPNVLSKACKCGKVSNEPNPARDIYLASLLSDADMFSLLCRTNGTVTKVIDIVSESHEYKSQKSQILRSMDVIEKITDASVTFYNLSHKKSVIKLELPKLRVIKKGRKIQAFKPSLMVILSDDTDTKSCIQGCIGLNGRLCKIGNPVSLALNDKQMFSKLSVIVKELEIISEKISCLDSEEMKDRRESLLKLANDTNIPSVGQKLFNIYEQYIRSIEEPLSEADELAEIMSFPSKIQYIAGLSGKKVPQYIIDKSEKLVGEMLTHIVA
ncbi:MAG: hypothetical protein IJ167_02350 [Lachnospiraceae bacterium]|nr:hypothetical protein [Lachnospiraceae bacterium]